MISLTAHTAASDHGLRAAWRRLRWNHPEWALAVVAAAAWLAVFATTPATSSGSGSLPAGHAHDALRAAPGGPHHVMTMPTTHWTLMVVAMMLPTVLPAARFVALTGKWTRRRRGPTIFVIGYLAVWIAVGSLVLAVLRLAGPAAHGRWAVVAALVTASLWELSAWKVRFLRACHRHPPIPPHGWKADAGCLKRGTSNGLACLGTCWAIMTPMMVTDHLHALWLMVPLAAVVAYQKAGTPSRVVRPVAAGLMAAAVGVAIW
jgi:predicted metal-binding membrane protein